MTVSTTAVSVSYSGDGNTTAFPITFQFGTSADLSVVLVNDDTGAETPQSLTTHYTVSQSAGGTGTLTMLTAPASGYTLRIRRITAKTQPDSLRNRGQYYPEMVEGMVNRTVRQIQEVGDEASRAIRLPIGSTASGQMTAPVPGALIGWNTDGDGIEQYPADSFSASLAAGITFQYAVSASATTLDVSDIPSPWVPQALFYNGVYQDLSAWGYASGQITFTEALPASGTVSVIATFTGPGQLNESEKVAFTRQATGAISRTLRAKLSDTVSVKDFGAVGDGTTDDTNAIRAAIAALGSRGGRVKFPQGTYLVSAEIVLDAPGLSLVGEGAGTTWDGLQNAASRIIGTHEAGAVVRIKWENCGIERIVIDSSGDRLGAARDTTASGYNAGIRVEADDVAAPEGDVFTTTLRGVYVRNQPNDGIIMVGRCYQSTVSDVFCTGNGGHGFCIDAGNRTSRANVYVPGVVTMQNVYCYRNAGHGICIGNKGDDFANLLSSLRVVAINCESNENDVDAAVAYEDYDAFVFGDNHVFIGCAFGGADSGGVAQDHGGIAIGGRSANLVNCRYLNPTRPARVLFYSGGTTVGTVFDGMSVRNASASEPVTIDVGAIKTVVRVADTTSTSSPVDSKAHQFIEYDYGGVHYKHGTEHASDFKSAFNRSIADNAVATLEFSTTTYGIIAVAGPTATSGPALFAFRVGTSPFCKLLAGDATYSEATTGALTGTTGTDTKMTVSAHTDNKLYVENRTSNTRQYEFTILSANGGRLLPGQ